jgi:arginine N-succinyltransferase
VLSGLGNKAFIAELMPKYPIYLPMLPESARSVIGGVHDNTAPALKMLQAEGFNFNGLVDIFDGGPVVEAFVHNIRTVRESVNRYAMVTQKPVNLDVPSGERAMISNRSFRDFRLTTIPTDCIGPETVSLLPAMAEALQIESGDSVRLAPLKDKGPLPIHTSGNKINNTGRCN